MSEVVLSKIISFAAS